MRDDPKYKRPLDAVSRLDRKNKFETNDLQEQQKTSADQQVSKETKQPDGFLDRTGTAKFSRQFLLAAHKRLDLPFNSRIRIPGTGRVIQDNRDQEGGRHHVRGDRDAHHREDSRRDVAEKEGRKDRGEKTRSAGEKIIRDGKAEDARDKKYENFLADRKLPFQRPQEASIQERKLSSFEEYVLRRFENGEEMARPLKEGDAKFLGKTKEEWKSFFAKFLGRTSGKQIDMDAVKEFTYRGYVARDNMKAVVISDLIHNDGKIEKFIRFGVLYEKMEGLLKRLLPGEVITRQMVKDALASEKLRYLALNPPSGDQEIMTSAKPKQGIFGREAMEQMVARELGIALDDDGSASRSIGSGRKRKGRGVGGFFKDLLGEDGPVDDFQGRFMPWWQWGRLTRPGGFKLKRAFYSALFITFVIVILVLLHTLISSK